MASLDLAGAQQAFASYTASMADDDEVERLFQAQGQQMAIFIAMLCGFLRGTSVWLFVNFAGLW